MIAKISLAISILLAIAVGNLWVSKGNTTSTVKETEEVKVAPALQTEGGPKATVLAYVNGDTLNAKYKFIVEKTKQLENKMSAAEQKVRREYADREQQVKVWETYMKNNKMTAEEQQTMQQDIMRIENEMAAIEEAEMGKMQKQESDLQKELLSRVNKYLDKFAKENGIDYVVNYQSGFQFILYGSNAYDITAQVVDGLNKEYEANKK